ncbi:hypothetical protein [Rhizobium phage RHph_N46]|nr:hypothetical protein [Rhizobium phage RHph_N46]
MNRKQLEAMVAELDKAVDVQEDGMNRARNAGSTNALMAATITKNVVAIIANGYKAALEVTAGEVEPLFNTGGKDLRRIPTYDDLKEFIDIYIRTQVGDSQKVRLDRDTMIGAYLDEDRIDEMTWMIYRNFLIKPGAIVVSDDCTVEEYIDLIFKIKL